MSKIVICANPKCRLRLRESISLKARDTNFCDNEGKCFQEWKEDRFQRETQDEFSFVNGIVTPMN